MQNSFGFTKVLFGVLFFVLVLPAQAAKPGQDVLTNSALYKSPPSWFKRTKAQKVVDRIQMKLEWSTRRVKVHFYDNQASFSQAHSLGPYVTAVSKKVGSEQSIHLGPRVNKDNFEKIFGHELVHIIIFQKYKTSIPKWLEEGLANHLAKKKKVNYQWLAKRPFPEDVTQMIHPMKGSKDDIFYHYVASQALAEMLEKRCDLQNLIRLSVERKMETYIRNTCEIQDVTEAFKEWVKKKAKKG